MSAPFCELARSEVPSIVLREVEKHFPGQDRAALSSLSLNFNGGGVTGLVGADGAGKTTLLRMLAGLLKPSAGSILLNGLDPVAQNQELRAQLGYMPQQFGLYEDLSVQENLNLYASLKDVTGREREEAFAALLNFTSLAPFTGRLAGKLSGGMKQKLGLACALLGKPAVLLLDEPGVGVDPISRRELWAMVHALAGQGMLVLWSTSYLDEAEQCGRILLLNEGRLVYSGVPEAFAARMEGHCFLAEAPAERRRALLREALLKDEVLDATIQGRRLRLVLGGLPNRTDRADLTTREDSVERLAAELRLPPAAFEPVCPRLEDSFIAELGGVALPRELDGAPPARTAGVLRHASAESALGVVIEARHLSKKFGSFAAADSIDFQVRRGEIFGLLGPNGAGKSTTFKMLCGLLRPSSGQALVMGLDLKRHTSAAKARIGYMAQKFSLYGNLSVAQNLEFFSSVYGLRGHEQRRRIDGMLATFSLGPLRGRGAASLPLGFKQRLALACAIMHRPDILFLDEPTSGVDPLTRREFWLYINSMVENGVTVLITTHFMDEAEYCDRIAMVYRGRLIACGSPDALKTRFVSPELPDPGMEDAFIGLIREHDQRLARS